MADDTTTAAPIFTLDGLLQKTPDLLKPVVAKYAPALIAMSAEEFCSWLEMLIMGRDDEAWRALLAKMPNAELLTAWREMATEWSNAATKNAARIDLQKSATLAVLKVLLTGALAMVGL